MTCGEEDKKRDRWPHLDLPHCPLAAVVDEHPEGDALALHERLPLQRHLEVHPPPAQQELLQHGVPGRRAAGGGRHLAQAHRHPHRGAPQRLLRLGLPCAQ